jgi:hypothetical protein
MTVAPQEVQAVLRRWFAQWGLPEQLRLDNGYPWGSGHDLPPGLALWLLGLGIQVIWNRPRHKQGNAVIERAHGVCQDWVEPATCATSAELQARLDRFTTLQREAYPVQGGRSRLAAYPALAAGGRPYLATREAELWDERRVWAWLTARIWTRRVDQVGRISLYNRAVRVGRAWAGTTVTVQLVVRPAGPTWLIRAADGTALGEPPAPELTRERIRSLTVARRRPRRAGAKPHGREGS